MPELSPAPVCCSKPPKAGPTSTSAQAFDISRNTSIRVRQLYLEGGLEAVLHDKRQQRYRQALTGGQAAHLIAITCSPVPTGHDHWTAALVGWQSRRIGLRRVNFAGNRSPVTQKNELKPWQHEQWCIPAVGAEFVAAMEDVLDLYEEDYDPLLSNRLLRRKARRSRGGCAPS